MADNYTSQIYEKAKSFLKPIVLTGLAALLSGCITMTGENGIYTVVTSPARPEQWKNHTTRTSIVSGIYVGIAAAALSGHGGGGGGSSDSNSGTGSSGGSGSGSGSHGGGSHDGGSKGGSGSGSGGGNPPPGGNGD